jgi:hypothetical protein
VIPRLCETKGAPTKGGLFLSGREADLAKLVVTPPPPADFRFWPDSQMSAHQGEGVVRSESSEYPILTQRRPRWIAVPVVHSLLRCEATHSKPIGSVVAFQYCSRRGERLRVQRFAQAGIPLSWWIRALTAARSTRAAAGVTRHSAARNRGGLGA